MRNFSLQTMHHQQGVTLVVGLAMLLILALMSHSSAEIGLNSEKVAHNTKLILQAEQSALSANQSAFDQDLYVNTALQYIDTPDFTAWPEYTVALNQAQIEAQAQLSTRRIALRGYSLASNTSVKQVLLEVDSQAQIHDRVNRRVAQGWVRVGAN